MLAAPGRGKDAARLRAVAGRINEEDIATVRERARILDLAADLFERERAVLLASLVREAGKTIEAAQAEVREACDYLRYYAGEARRLFAEPVRLKGPTGEENLLSLRGRGLRLP